jgi:hypothetical protein
MDSNISRDRLFLEHDIEGGGFRRRSRGFPSSRAVVSTWGTRTSGDTRRLLRGYVKLKKLIYYFMINTE